MRDYIIEHAGREKGKSIVDTVLPFDSYSPLVPGKRGCKIGGAQLFSDKSYFGCCACIGSAGRDWETSIVAWLKIK